MKRISNLFLTLFTFILFSFAFTACKTPVTADGDYVLLTAKNVEEQTTLVEYMQTLQEDGKLSYTVEDGMVVSINGKANEANSYWMLYTTDDEFSNEAWGTIEYEEITYKSASLGAEELVVKEGETYVWVYTTF